MNEIIANDNYVDDNDDGSNEPSLLMLTVDAAVEQLTREEDQADLEFIGTRLIARGFEILCNRTSYGIAGAVAWITRLIRMAPKERADG